MVVWQQAFTGTIIERLRLHDNQSNHCCANHAACAVRAFSPHLFRTHGPVVKLAEEIVQAVVADV